jgi:preprotein translocase subunit YajC
MWLHVLQNLGVLLLAILFSVFFYFINTRKAKIKKQD